MRFRFFLFNTIADLCGNFKETAVQLRFFLIFKKPLINCCRVFCFGSNIQHTA
ncbi:Uncharacterised protein [Mycobacteroides abscessus subsp. abscessus]|nr:Uncharacterised protein [Mycobacteroides abscessus subsp. abscessus]